MFEDSAILVFWVVTAGACLRPTARMRGAFLAVFFGLLISCGL